jgi:hypothetical protein
LIVLEFQGLDARWPNLNAVRQLTEKEKAVRNIQTFYRRKDVNKYQPKKPAPVFSP